MLNLSCFQLIWDVRMPERIRTSFRRRIARRLSATRLVSGPASLRLVAATLVAVLCCAGTAPAQTQSDRVVELFTCKDVMREPNASREVAIAFLHGYLLGKSGSSKFNVEALESQTNAFIEQCLDNPQSKAVDVMTRLKG
jgi:hypothetical protein